MYCRRDVKKIVFVNSGVQMILINPRFAVMEKLVITKFIEKIGKENVFLSIEDAIRGCKFSLTYENGNGNGNGNVSSRPEEYIQD